MVEATLVRLGPFTPVSNRRQSFPVGSKTMNRTGFRVWAVFARGCPAASCFTAPVFLSVSNISSALPFNGGFHEPSEAQVHGFDRDLGRFVDARMSHHVPVRVIEAYEIVLSAEYGFAHRVGDVGGLHPGPFFERHAVGFDFDIGFEFLVDLS